MEQSTETRRPREPLAYEVDNVEIYRKQAMRAAKELGYGVKVIVKIKLAETQAEITRIMNSTRNSHFDQIDERDRITGQIKKSLRKIRIEKEFSKYVKDI